ncbi:MAG: hypothetical protein ABIH92_04485 [Nanoarchaeota archaeon]
MVMRGLWTAGLGVLVSGCVLAPYVPSQEDDFEELHRNAYVEELRASNATELDEIFGICNNDLGCLKEASSLYPEFRDEICDRVEEVAYEMFGEDFAEGHRRECEAGTGYMVR